ncbi:MAG: flagellar export chaperone FliS [Phycisphaeraceae bacterium]
MPAPATNPYLRTKIMTASPEQLRLMLYDGAIKFCRQGRDALARQDFEASYHALMRAQKIVLELSNSLNADVDPALCQRLAALYTYIYRRLVDANMTREPDAVDEAIRLIDYERETWQMLIRKLHTDDEPAPDGPAAPPANPYAAGAPAPNRLSHSA